MERKLAAILAAGVVGYSRLMVADEARILAALTPHWRAADNCVSLRHRSVPSSRTMWWKRKSRAS